MTVFPENRKLIAMEVYRPLRAVLFFYEIVRLLVVLGLIVLVMGSGENSGRPPFPYLLFAAPNALFPLMSLFVWLRFSDYRAYIGLYVAGKGIVLAAALGWLLFSPRESSPLSFITGWERLSIVIGLGLLLLADAGSIGGTVLLRTAALKQGRQIKDAP